MSGFAPTPACMDGGKGVLCRIHVKGAGVYTTEATDLDTAREVALHFTAELVAAMQPGALPLVPFPASGNRIDLMVKAEEVSVVEVIRVDPLGRPR